jgi:hypothetical protein
MAQLLRTGMPRKYELYVLAQAALLAACFMLMSRMDHSTTLKLTATRFPKRRLIFTV